MVRSMNLSGSPMDQRIRKMSVCPRPPLSRCRRCARSRSIMRTERSPTVRSSRPIDLSLAANLSTAAADTPIPPATRSAATSAALRAPSNCCMHAHLDRPEAEILARLRVLDDEALLAAVGLLDDGEVGPELGRAAHGVVRTTFSPAAIPLTTSTRLPSRSRAEGDRAERGAVVVPHERVAVLATAERGMATTRRRSAPSCTVTLLPGVSAEPGASCSTTSRVPLAASMTGEARTTRAAALAPPDGEHPRRRADPECGRGRLRHADRGQNRGERGDAEERIARVDQPLHPRHARGDHPVERRDDAGQVVVALRLSEREIGRAVLELHLLRIGASDHAGGGQRALPLDPLRGVGRLLAGLGERDLLVGALEPGERAGRPPRACRCRPGCASTSPRTAPATAASCST